MIAKAWTAKSKTAQTSYRNYFRGLLTYQRMLYTHDWFSDRVCELDRIERFLQRSHVDIVSSFGSYYILYQPSKLYEEAQTQYW